jgi:hypothetical protein
MARVAANRRAGAEVVERELELAGVDARRCTSECDRRNRRSEPEVVEDGCGEVGVGEEREHAKPIVTAWAPGDVLAEQASRTRSGASRPCSSRSYSRHCRRSNRGGSAWRAWSASS